MGVSGSTTFTVIFFTPGISFSIGKASVFKYIPYFYPYNICVTSGVVWLAGGRGVPAAFHVWRTGGLTGISSSSFKLMFGVVWFSLILETAVERGGVCGYW